MTNNSSNSGRNLQLCDHCGKKLGKLCNLIVPSNVDIELFGAKIETICIKCAVKEGRIKRKQGSKNVCLEKEV